VDALSPYPEKIEAHILEQAGIVFDAAVEPENCAWWLVACNFSKCNYNNPCK